MKDSTDGLFRKAHELLAAGQPGQARSALESLLAADPGNAQAHLVLGGIAWRENRTLDAAAHALDAARVAPEDAVQLGAVIAALLQAGEYAAARECLRRPALTDSRDGALLMRMAGWQQVLGDHEASLALYERAHALGVDGFEYRFEHATQLSFNGRLRESEEEMDRCVGMGVPSGRLYSQLARLRRQTPERNHLDAIERMLAIVRPGSEDHAGLEFARYKELEDLGRYGLAWACLARGNALLAARTRYDAPRRDRLLDGLRALSTREFLRPADADHDGPIPIFIIGMTRSGTTVLDRVLGSHSQVTSAGELKDFGRQLRMVAGQRTLDMLDEVILERLPAIDLPEVGRRYLAQTQWRANGRGFYVDKFPPNWQLAGLIRRALPQARLVHMVRDPMDVCFSNFRALFGESYAWSYDVQRLVHYYRQYRRTMDHWHEAMPGQILDVAYADLVRDPEATARTVLDFCGLDYEEGCVDIRRNKAAVATLSLAQVRDGVHARAFREWEPYATQLAGLQDALRNL